MGELELSNYAAGGDEFCLSRGSFSSGALLDNLNPR